MVRITRIFRAAVIMAVFFVAGKTAFSQDFNSALNMTYQQKFEAADSAFNRLIMAEPANGKYYYYSGENQLASYFLDTVNISFKSIAPKAVERFKKGIAANPNEPLNYVGLGKVAVIQDNTAMADENFAKAQTFLPARKVKSSLTKPEQANLLIRIADAYVQVGSRDTALVFGLLRKAEQLDPKNPELFLLRGDYYINTLNDGSHAAENYKRSQDFSPQSTRARVRLGQLYTRIKSYEDALGYYQDAVAIDPSFAPAYLEMGFLFAKTKQQEESKKYFKKYLDLSKGNIAAKRKYANMLIQTDDYKGAIEQITQILVMDSVSFNDLNRALAYSYYEEKQLPRAKYYINKFFSNSPAEKITAKDYLYLGHILMKTNEDSLGISNLVKSYEKDTTNIDLLTEIATSYNKIKKYENAARTYQLKIQKNAGKPNPNDYFRMGRAYYDARLWVEADSALAKVNRMSPDFEPAWVLRGRVYSSLDPDTKEGLAKPFYDKVVERAILDQAKYAKDLIEAYSYLGYYFLVNKQYCESLGYWDKIVGIDPNNENAKSALNDLKKNCPEFKSANQPQ